MELDNLRMCLFCSLNVFMVDCGRNCEEELAVVVLDVTAATAVGAIGAVALVTLVLFVKMAVEVICLSADRCFICRIVLGGNKLFMDVVGADDCTW